MGYGSDGCCSVRNPTPGSSLRAPSFELNREACGIPHASFFLGFERSASASHCALRSFSNGNHSESSPGLGGDPTRFRVAYSLMNMPN